MDYNVDNASLVLPEYGRHVHKMVYALAQIQDRAERTTQAEAIVRVMERMSGETERMQDDFDRRLWDHLYIMSGFTLDVDAPYPMPTKESMQTRSTPQQLIYPSSEEPVGPYGAIATSMLDVIADVEDASLQEELLVGTARQMKRNALQWSGNHIQDSDVRIDVMKLSKGYLQVPEEVSLEVKRVSRRTRAQVVKRRSGSIAKNRASRTERGRRRVGGRLAGRSTGRS